MIYLFGYIIKALSTTLSRQVIKQNIVLNSSLIFTFKFSPCNIYFVEKLETSQEGKEHNATN